MLEDVLKTRNSRYAKLSSGEYVLLEIAFSDGTFMVTPEYHKYMNWPHRREHTLIDTWEWPLVPVKGGSRYKVDLDDTQDMLLLKNIENYRNGTWKVMRNTLPQGEYKDEFWKPYLGKSMSVK